MADPRHTPSAAAGSSSSTSVEAPRPKFFILMRTDDHAAIRVNKIGEGHDEAKLQSVSDPGAVYRVTPAEHLNLDGQNEFSNTGMVSCFAYHQGSLHQEGLDGVLTYPGNNVHFIILDERACQQINLNGGIKFDQDESSTIKKIHGRTKRTVSGDRIHTVADVWEKPEFKSDGPQILDTGAIQLADTLTKRRDASEILLGGNWPPFAMCVSMPKTELRRYLEKTRQELSDAHWVEQDRIASRGGKRSGVVPRYPAPEQLIGYLLSPERKPVNLVGKSPGQVAVLAAAASAKLSADAEKLAGEESEKLERARREPLEREKRRREESLRWEKEAAQSQEKRARGDAERERVAAERGQFNVEITIACRKLHELLQPLKKIDRRKYNRIGRTYDDKLKESGNMEELRAHLTEAKDTLRKALVAQHGAEGFDSKERKTVPDPSASFSSSRTSASSSHAAMHRALNPIELRLQNALAAMQQLRAELFNLPDAAEVDVGHERMNPKELLTAFFTKVEKNIRESSSHGWPLKDQADFVQEQVKGAKERLENYKGNLAADPADRKRSSFTSGPDLESRVATRDASVRSSSSGGGIDSNSAAPAGVQPPRFPPK